MSDYCIWVGVVRGSFLKLGRFTGNMHLLSFPTQPAVKQAPVFSLMDPH